MCYPDLGYILQINVEHCLFCCLPQKKKIPESNSHLGYLQWAKV